MFARYINGKVSDSVKSQLYAGSTDAVLIKYKIG